MFHKWEQQETEASQIISFEKIVQDKIKDIAAMANRHMDSILQLIIKLNQELEVMKESVGANKEEFSSNLEDSKNACQQVMTKLENYQLKLSSKENKDLLVNLPQPQTKNQRKK